MSPILHQKSEGPEGSKTDATTLGEMLVQSVKALPPSVKDATDGWKEAAIAWEVCASLHEKWCKGKDALFTTRQADYLKHAENARNMFSKLAPQTEDSHETPT